MRWLRSQYFTALYVLLTLSALLMAAKADGFDIGP